jgi:hypothetical protein
MVPSLPTEVTVTGTIDDPRVEIPGWPKVCADSAGEQVDCG